MNDKLFDYHPISLRVHSASPNESLFGPQMGPCRIPKRIHFHSPNETTSGPQMSPFRDSPNDPKMTTLSNEQKTSRTWGIVRENAGLRTSGPIAESPSHSLSHPSDGFATTPARTAAARASVKPEMSATEAQSGLSSEKLGFRFRVCFQTFHLISLFGRPKTNSLRSPYSF